MFNKELKLRLESLELLYASHESEIKALKETVIYLNKKLNLLEAKLKKK
jgi:hypothetical protein